MLIDQDSKAKYDSQTNESSKNQVSTYMNLCIFDKNVNQIVPY